MGSNPIAGNIFSLLKHMFKTYLSLGLDVAHDAHVVHMLCTCCAQWEMLIGSLMQQVYLIRKDVLLKMFSRNKICEAFLFFNINMTVKSEDGDV